MTSEQSDRLTISAALRQARRTLRDAGLESPGLDAEVLLRHLLRLDRTALYMRLTEPIAPDVLHAFQTLLAERERGVPVAYLVGEREFMGLPFQVGPGVLVPRPETELLVEWALGWLRARPAATVLDVGTGSGAIALSIAASLGRDWPGRILASDVSPAALEVAERNRAQLGLTSRVELVQGSLVDWRAEPVDLLLANLPYLRPGQIAENPALAAEPRLALDGGQDGLDVLRRLIADAPRVVAPGGAVGLELDPSQCAAVTTLAEQAFPGAIVSVLRDLAGHDRHLLIDTATGGHPHRSATIPR